MKIKAHLLFLLSIFVVLYSAGCKDSPTENIYNIYSADSLSDPNIDPRVVFTNPSDGSSGPYGNTDPTQYQPYPQLTIQFNKLINLTNYGYNSISLKTDDADYQLSLNTNYGDIFNNILIFDINERYLASKTYTLTIDSTFTDVHGKKLDKPYVAHFIPEPKFRVYQVYPTWTDIEPLQSPQIYMLFNSKIDTAIFSSISVSPQIEGYWALSSNYYSSDSLRAYFIFSDTLAYNTEYTVSLSSDARDAGGLLIDRSYQYSFKTAPFHVRLNSYSNYLGPGGFYISNNFGFEFNALVDTSTVRNSISVSPQISYSISYYWGLYYKYVRIDFVDEEFQSNTEYTIHFAPTIKSIYGDYLEDYSYSFKTGP